MSNDAGKLRHGAAHPSLQLVNGMMDSRHILVARELAVIIDDDYSVEFHEHDHSHGSVGDISDDAHQRAHASDIEKRFAGQTNITTGQIIMFGLTGGLIPCPAAITVLLLCFQLKQFSLGVVLVLCFSIGLALTMVAAGVAAALSVRHISTRWSGFDAFARRAPYASGAVIILVGLYMGVQGFIALSHPVQHAELPLLKPTVAALSYSLEK